LNSLTLEDTNLTFLEIENRFGKEVAAGVLALTKNEGLEGKRAKNAG
jgi:(p)ppGpp synthase/HD superfamily hydrolase